MSPARARALVLCENRARYGSESFCARCRRVRRFVKVVPVIPRRVAPELVAEPTNYQVLCRDCHRLKTREDRATWPLPRPSAKAGGLA